MDPKARILKNLQGKHAVFGSDLRRLLGVSRQAVNKHLKGLIQAKKVSKTGSTRGAFYSLVSAQKKPPTVQSWKRFYALKGLDEALVFDELSRKANLKKALAKNVYEIFRFGFTEMLNNAIDHSGSKRAWVEISTSPYGAGFKIRDWGIGVYHSIASRFHLKSERDAAGELLKGKTTTMAKRHSGEGIFFTSKAADRFLLRSHQQELEFDNLKADVFLKETRNLKGTEISFTIARNSKRNLAEIFNQFAPPEHDYRFEKTKVAVKLFQESYVSRSEAKRLLTGLDKFKEVELDFQGVRSIGQGFADEIFRVFKNVHPSIQIRAVRARPVVQTMIKHVVDNKR